MKKPVSITDNAFEYVTKVSRMGDKSIFWIPLKYRDVIDEKFDGMEVVVSVEQTDLEPENTRISK